MIKKGVSAPLVPDPHLSIIALRQRPRTQNQDTSGLSITAFLLSKDDTAAVVPVSCATAKGSMRLKAKVRPSFIC